MNDRHLFVFVSVMSNDRQLSVNEQTRQSQAVATLPVGTVHKLTQTRK